MGVAFTSILAPRADIKAGKKPWTLGIADSDEYGYAPVKETGEPADPFYVAPYPTRFDTKDEADAEADRLNLAYFGLDRLAALKIVAGSMRRIS